MKFIIIMAFVLNISHANTIPFYKAPEIIGNSIDKYFDLVSNSLEGQENSGHLYGPYKDVGFYFHRIKIRVEPFVKFGINNFAEFKIWPIFEIELVRKPPQGWEDYHP